MEIKCLYSESMEPLNYLDLRMTKVQFIYLLSINCDEELETFFERLCEVVANEACRLIPKHNGKRLTPESFELVKTSENG